MTTNDHQVGENAQRILFITKKPQSLLMHNYNCDSEFKIDDRWEYDKMRFGIKIFQVS